VQQTEKKDAFHFAQPLGIKKITEIKIIQLKAHKQTRNLSRITLNKSQKLNQHCLEIALFQ
jgi:hypothetical protein